MSANKFCLFLGGFVLCVSAQAAFFSVSFTTQFTKCQWVLREGQKAANSKAYALYTLLEGTTQRQVTVERTEGASGQSRSSKDPMTRDQFEGSNLEPKRSLEVFPFDEKTAYVRLNGLMLEAQFTRGDWTAFAAGAYIELEFTKEAQKRLAFCLGKIHMLEPLSQKPESVLGPVNNPENPKVTQLHFTSRTILVGKRDFLHLNFGDYTFSRIYNVDTDPK